MKRTKKASKKTAPVSLRSIPAEVKIVDLGPLLRGKNSVFKAKKCAGGGQ